MYVTNKQTNKQTVNKMCLKPQKISQIKLTIMYKKQDEFICYYNTGQREERVLK